MCAGDPLGSREWLGEGDKGIGKRMPENEQYMKKQLQTVSKWKKMEETQRAGDGGWEKVRNNRTHREECIKDEEKNNPTWVFQEKMKKCFVLGMKWKNQQGALWEGGLKV